MTCTPAATDFVNLILVRRGYAQPPTTPPNDEFADRFARAARRARIRGVGLWGLEARMAPPSACRVPVTAPDGVDGAPVSGPDLLAAAELARSLRRVIESPMTATLPPEVQRVFDRFITTEFTTVDQIGSRSPGPDPLLRTGRPCIDVTTGLGYPKKANDARANPKVALLFSTRPVAGWTTLRTCSCRGPPMSTTATSTPTASATGASPSQAPGAKSRYPKVLETRLLDWYLTRVYIHVRPERVYVWPDGDAAEPQLFDAHMEEVRSGHDEEPAGQHASPRAAGPVWDPRRRSRRALRERRLARRARRVPVLGAPARRGRSRRAPGRARGRASRRAVATRPRVRHGARPLPEFNWQRNFQVRGDLIEEDGLGGGGAAQAGGRVRAARSLIERTR